MELAFANMSPTAVEADLLVLGAFEDDHGSAAVYSEIDGAMGGRLSDFVKAREFRGKSGESLVLQSAEIGAREVALVGLGPRHDFEIADGRKFANRVHQLAADLKARHIAIVPPLDEALARLSGFIAEGLLLAAYRFDKFKSEEATFAVERVTLLSTQEKPPSVELSRARVVANAVTLARDLVNRPGSDLTPSELAAAAQQIAQAGQLDCTIWGPKECAKQKMNLFLAVARGSSEEPRFIHLVYKPKGSQKPARKIGLVGKGVTFDSGGLSLKPSASMLDMKCDMGGAALVLGVASALRSLNLNLEVHIVVAAAENMLSGNSYKLGDVFVGASGKSVEIVNTDAEGRLTMADALHFVVNQGVDEVLDFATLTGACMIALGPYTAAVMGRDHGMVERVLASGRRTGESLWRLPLNNDLRGQLDSDIADIKNAGERWGGAITAGLFLEEFVGDTPWVHLDIAGPTFLAKAKDHLPAGGTGFGVATILDYLASKANASS